jgi:Rrf2 family transcriptional regulator, iron-sulfur cluster assembly transcription factor
MISNTCKYAIRAVIYLSLYSSSKKKVGLKEISDKLDIPTPFLGKILQTLARQKILVSTKGPNGGFTLGREAIDITVMEVIELIDGTDTFDTCLIRTSKCNDDEPCALHEKVTEVRKQLKLMFVTQSIADLADEFREKPGKIKI